MSKDNSLVKPNSSLIKRSSRVYAPSGKEILQNLIAVADKADRQCSPQLLARGWEGGHFGNYIDRIVHQLGLAEIEMGAINPPLQGLVTHLALPQQWVVPFSRHIHFEDYTTFSQLPPDTEVLTTFYFIDYSLWSSERYYRSDAYDDPKNKYWGSCKGKMLSFFHSLVSEARGCKEYSAVEREIGEILSPHQLNDFPFSFGALHHRDIFEYNSRLFTSLNYSHVQRLPGPIGKHTPGEGKINKFDSVELLWRISFHRYDSSGEVLLGSIPLNSTSSISSLLLPPH